MPFILLIPSSEIQYPGPKKNIISIIDISKIFDFTYVIKHHPPGDRQTIFHLINSSSFVSKPNITTHHARASLTSLLFVFIASPHSSSCHPSHPHRAALLPPAPPLGLGLLFLRVPEVTVALSARDVGAMMPPLRCLQFFCRMGSRRNVLAAWEFAALFSSRMGSCRNVFRPHGTLP